MLMTSFFEKLASQPAQRSDRPRSIMFAGLGLVIAVLLTRGMAWGHIRVWWLIGGSAVLIGAANLVRAKASRWLLTGLAFALSLFTAYLIYHIAA